MVQDMDVRAVHAAPFLHPCPIELIVMPPRPIASQFNKLPRCLGIFVAVDPAFLPKQSDKPIERLAYCFCLPCRIDQLPALLLG